MGGNVLEWNAYAPVYLGLIDDKVQEFPWEFPVDLELFNASLAFAVLLGGPVLINDGYLLNLPEARTAILQPESSPLRQLTEIGYVRVLYRGLRAGKSVPDTVERMAAQRINTFANKSDEYRKAARRLDEWIFENPTIAVPWPNKDLGFGLAALLRQLQPEDVGLPEEKLAPVLKQFERLWASGNEGARSCWESAINGCKTKGLIPMSSDIELMRAANQAYHFNFAACIAAENQAGGLVATRYSKSFASMVETFDVPEAREPLAVENLVGLTRSSDLPRLRLAKKNLWSSGPFADGKALRKCLEDPQFTTLKRRYGYRMFHAMSGEVEEGEFIEAAQQYASVVQKLLAEAISNDRTKKATDIATTGLSLLGKRVLGLVVRTFASPVVKRVRLSKAAVLELKGKLEDDLEATSNPAADWETMARDPAIAHYDPLPPPPDYK